MCRVATQHLVLQRREIQKNYSTYNYFSEWMSIHNHRNQLQSNNV